MGDANRPFRFHSRRTMLALFANSSVSRCTTVSVAARPTLALRMPTRASSNAFPTDVLYVRTHEWLRVEGDTATVGITQHACDELGEVVFADMNDPSSDVVRIGHRLGALESVKAASDVYAPASGVVTATNSALVEQPSMINESPYDKGWLVKIKLANFSEERKEMLTAAEYEQFLKERA